MKFSPKNNNKNWREEAEAAMPSSARKQSRSSFVLECFFRSSIFSLITFQYMHYQWATFVFSVASPTL